MGKMRLKSSKTNKRNTERIYVLAFIKKRPGGGGGRGGGGDGGGGGGCDGGCGGGGGGPGGGGGYWSVGFVAEHGGGWGAGKRVTLPELRVSALWSYKEHPSGKKKKNETRK